MNTNNKLILLSLALLTCYTFLSTSDSAQPSDAYIARILDEIEGQENKIIEKTLDNGDITFINQENNDIAIIEEENNASTNNPAIYRFRELQEYAFMGMWTLEGNNKLFNSFSGVTGKIRMKFFTEYMMPAYWNLLSNVTVVQLTITDGEYSDNTMFVVRLNDTLANALDTSTMMYSMKNKSINVWEFDKLELQTIQACAFDLEANLSSIIKQNPENLTNYTIVPQAEIPVTIRSTECDVNFSVRLHRDETDYERKTINYSVLLTFIAIINLYAIAKLIKSSLESTTEANKISMLTIGFITVWDTYICLAHLYLALSMESLFHFFIMPTFWYFILFSIFEVKLLIILWRARYWDRFENLDVIRRAAVTFYCKLYSAITILLIIFYKFMYYNVFLLFMSLYLVPQIVHNTLRGGRIDFNGNYMFLIVGIRVILPLYFKGCPNNLLQITPSLTFCVCLVIIVAFQIIIIYYQTIYGSKFFVPLRFMPPQYDYLYNLKDDLEAGLTSQDDCAVCMYPLNQPSQQHPAPNTHSKRILNRLRPKKGQIMKTPCGHKFHVSCLVEWMSIKMDCPTCRSTLPLLE